MSDVLVSQRGLATASARQAPASTRSSLPIHFGTWLKELVERLEVQEQEIATLKERLGRLEPIEAPITVAEICKKHGFKQGAVRDWLFRRSTNGLEKTGAVVTRGRRVYLYEGAFLRWLRDANSSFRRKR